MRTYLLPCLSALALTASIAVAQPVISAKSGVVQHVEGRVLLNGEITRPKFAQFPELKTGQSLATEEGRVEMLLTPGVFLRMPENSEVKMLSNSLTNTGLEIVSGSALIEVAELLKDNAIYFQVGDARIQMEKSGLYRIDTNPMRLQVYEGRADVVTSAGKLTAKKGNQVDLDAAKLASAKFDTKTSDEFYRWSSRRTSYISAANVTSARTAGSSSYTSGGNAGLGSWNWNPYFGMFTYMPMRGVYYSPFGSAFYSPGAIQSMYFPAASYVGIPQRYGTSAVSRPSAPPLAANPGLGNFGGGLRGSGPTGGGMGSGGGGGNPNFGGGNMGGARPTGGTMGGRRGP
jgi:hypothetical protein